VYTNSGFSLSVKSNHLHTRQHTVNSQQPQNSLLVLQPHILGGRPNLRLLLILQHAVHVDEREYAQTHAPAHDDRDLGGHVARRVFGAESLRAWMISTVPRQKDVNAPMMLPAQYPIKYIAATVVFFV
jgi:hypothetical protein